MSSATMTAPAQQTREGQFTINLWDIDPTVFPNYRTIAREVDLENLRKGLGMNRNGEQLQNLIGCFDPLRPDVFALYGGFSRLEAMSRNALQSLCDEWNKTKNLKAADPEFVACGGKGFESRKDRLRILDAGGDWAKRYEEAMKGYLVRVFACPVKDDLEAMEKNMIENKLRSDPPLSDELARVQTLVSRDVPGKRIAVIIGKSASAISQYKKIADMPAAYEDMFKEAFGNDEVRMPVARKAMASYVNRLSLPASNEAAVPFSHARDLAQAVLHKEKPLNFEQSYRLLRALVNMDDMGNLDEDKPVMFYSIFKIMIDDAVTSMSLAPATPPTAQGIAPVSTGNTATSNAATNTETLQSLGEKQAATNTAAPTTAEQTSTEQSIKDVNATLSTSPTVPSGIAPVLTASTGALPITPEATGVAPLATTGLVESTEVDVNDLLAQIGEESVLPQSAADAGEKRVSTTQAPDERFKTLAPQKLYDTANKSVVGANDPDMNMNDRSSHLLRAVTLFEVIGLDKEMNTVNEAYIQYSEQVDKYLTELEKLTKSKSSAEEWERLQGLRPKFAGLKVG